MARYFDINQPGYSVKCKLYCDSPREVEHCIIFLHGFGGHKDNKAAERFAENVHSKMKRTAVLTFDWPCHGKDVRRKLTLDDCKIYLKLVLNYVKEELDPVDIFAYGTSFGAYLTLKYIYEEGNPFKKIVLRAAAITMYESMLERIMTPENKALIDRGKEALVGFDRKVKVDKNFIEELREHDIRKNDYIDFAEDILMVHGEKDEIIPVDEVKKFADDNVIECIVVKNADHRFQNLDLLKLAHSYFIKFYETAARKK